jgi:hypothetical protein
LETNLESDNLAEHIFNTNIDTDDTLFNQQKKVQLRNIRKAFGVPSILLEDGDNNLW